MIGRIVNFFGDAKYARTRRRVFYLALALIVIADFLVPREHAEYFWEALPGWSAVYGLASCVALIVVSKFLGHQVGLMRDEDYYD